MRRFLIAVAIVFMAFGGVLGLTASAPQAQVIPFAFWQNDDGGFGNALRFRSSISTYMTRAGSAGNRQKWTWSGWIKRGGFGGSYQTIFSDGANSYTTALSINSAHQLYFGIGDGASSGTYLVTTNAVLRDASAWYHIVWAVDTTQATAGDRSKIYVNGVQITSFASTSYPAQNYNGGMNNSNTFQLGRNTSSNPFLFDGAMADVNFVDGQTLTPSNFAETDSNNQWVPKTYSGAYGTNGFHLNFSDASALTATAIGADSSGNGNNFTPANFVLSVDSQTDAPASGSNFATLNPLAGSPNVTIDTGNLRALSCTGGNFCKTMGTMGVSSGKWYWEYEITERGDSNSLLVGVASAPPLRDTSNQNGVETGSTHVTVYNTSFSDTAIMVDGSAVTTGLAATTNGQVISVALDADASKVYFYRNGSVLGNAGGYTATNASGMYWPVVHTRTQSTGSIVNVNFGQRTLSYTPPTGYQLLKTENLSTPAVVNPSPYFKIATYTGNGGVNSIGEPAKKTSSVSIANSLRFRSGNSAYLTRTQTAGSNRKTFTISVWAKLSMTATGNVALMEAYSSGTSFFVAGLDSSNRPIMYSYYGGADYGYVFSNIIRDPTSWHHLMYVVDTDNGTAADRFRVYLDGMRLTSIVTDYGTPGSGYVTDFFNPTHTHSIGRRLDTGTYWNGYMADVQVVDGQALTPSSFGEYDSDGDWVPKSYGGAYGTNGFRLDFSDASNTTATTLGKDSAGSNNWTPNGFSVTAGITNDALTDTPTAYDASHGNFATMDTLNTSSASIVSDGGLKVTNTGTGTSWYGIGGTMAVTSGKWYYETEYSGANSLASGVIGFAETSVTMDTDTSDQLSLMAGWLLRNDSAGLGEAYTNFGTSASFAAGADAPATGTVMLALDMDSQKFWVGRDGTWFASGNPSTGTNPTGTFAAGKRLMPVGIPVAITSVGSTVTFNYNFGQRAFSYTPPTGFQRWNTYNLANSSFTPDLAIVKNRSTAVDWAWYDRQRGAALELSSNSTAAQSGQSTGLLNFQNGGFTIGSSSKLNTSGSNYVSYMFKEGATPGFDIVTYTGNGANRTIAHSLGAAPSLIVVKATNLPNSVARPWIVYHKSLGATKVLYLNTTDTPVTLSTYWNNTAPTSSVFSLGTENNVNNAAGTVGEYVAYLWSEVPGFSKFGSYTGNGSTDGPFIHTGFKPAFVMIKATSASGNNWNIRDTTRSSYNPIGQGLLSNTSDAETGTTWNQIDVTSNGFKIRASGTDVNSSGVSYVYAAFAENPFKYSTAR